MSKVIPYLITYKMLNMANEMLLCNKKCVVLNGALKYSGMQSLEIPINRIGL